jgi:hypothetical protein
VSGSPVPILSQRETNLLYVLSSDFSQGVFQLKSSFINRGKAKLEFSGGKTRFLPEREGFFLSAQTTSALSRTSHSWTQYCCRHDAHSTANRSRSPELPPAVSLSQARCLSTRPDHPLDPDSIPKCAFYAMNDHLALELTIFLEPPVS